MAAWIQRGFLLVEHVPSHLASDAGARDTTTDVTIEVQAGDQTSLVEALWQLLQSNAHYVRATFSSKSKEDLATWVNEKSPYPLTVSATVTSAVSYFHVADIPYPFHLALMAFLHALARSLAIQKLKDR